MHFNNVDNVDNSDSVDNVDKVEYVDAFVFVCFQFCHFWVHQNHSHSCVVCTASLCTKQSRRISVKWSASKSGIQVEAVVMRGSLTESSDGR